MNQRPFNIVPKMPVNSGTPCISITTGQTINPQSNRMTRSVDNLINKKIWTFAFETQSSFTQTVEPLYDIYEIDVQQLLIAVPTGGLFTGTSLYLNIEGFTPTTQYSARTYNSQGTNGAVNSAIPFVPGIPGICHPQPWAIFKNAEGNIGHQLKMTVTDYTGTLIPVVGYITLKIKCLNW